MKKETFENYSIVDLEKLLNAYTEIRGIIREHCNRNDTDKYLNDKYIEVIEAQMLVWRELHRRTNY